MNRIPSLFAEFESEFRRSVALKMALNKQTIVFVVVWFVSIACTFRYATLSTTQHNAAYSEKKLNHVFIKAHHTGDGIHENEAFMYHYGNGDHGDSALYKITAMSREETSNVDFDNFGIVRAAFNYYRVSIF